VHDQAFFQGAGKAALIGGIGGAFSFGIGQVAMGMSGFGKVAFQTLTHGHLGGMMSGMSGGTYSQGFLSGAAGSLVATGAGSLFSNANKGVQAFGMIGGGALAGGIGAKIAGGDFWDGARNGAISAGLNHGIHSGLFGEGLMVSSITGRTRHLFGPDAMSFDGTFDVSSGVAMGIEKGGLVTIHQSLNNSLFQKCLKFIIIIHYIKLRVIVNYILRWTEKHPVIGLLEHANVIV